MRPPASAPTRDPGGHDPAAFERLLAVLSTSFIDLPADRIDAHIEELLGLNAEFFGLDRSAVGQGDGEAASTYRITHRWFRQGLEAQTLATGVQQPWFAERLARGESIVLDDVEDLPPEAVAEREYTTRFGHRSLVFLPLRVAGHGVGAVAFATVREPRHWTPETLTRLGMVAQVIASALGRKSSDLALRGSLEETERLRRRLEAENLYLRAEIQETHDFEEIVGRSVALRAALHQVDQVAPTDAPVLLTGETGTGKELIARAIHARSRRSARPLIAVNCAAMPATLVESELFGHERGAFTGATQSRPGRFELADGGTLFLDEIGDLELQVQAKLLRALQDGEVQRLGATRSRKVDVRVIAATNRVLREEIRSERFRSDLYYRLSVFPIELPPLRDRREDVPLLVWYFVQARQRELGRAIERIPSGVMATLAAYDWPGNVRELQNVIERALILSRGPVLELHDPVLQGVGQLAARTAAPAPNESLAGAERAHILAVLERCDWRIEGHDRAAARLGMKPSTLRNRMRKLGIARPAGP